MKRVAVDPGARVAASVDGGEDRRAGVLLDQRTGRCPQGAVAFKADKRASKLSGTSLLAIEEVATAPAIVSTLKIWITPWLVAAWAAMAS